MATCPSCRNQYPEGTTVCAKDGEGLLPDVAFSGVDAPLAEGLVVGEYRIECKIGVGGFGTVYRAVHPLIGKAAAVKVLARKYSGDPQMVARFIAEARAVNQIRHRHIVDIFAFGSLEDGRQYFVMELLEGMTLDTWLRQKRRLKPEEAIPILRAVGRALDAAHARNIAHRDLKPENIFLVMQDGDIFPKLLDFGIAKLMGDAAGSNGLRTDTGSPIGTPCYMSPEQCRARDIDHRTDIYSFGIMTHELLAGKVPFGTGDVVEILMNHIRTRPPSLSSCCPELSPALDAPILAMLEKDPARRPRSIGEAVEALARAAREAGYPVPLPQIGDSGARITPPPEGASARALGEAVTVTSGPMESATFKGTTAERLETTPPPARRSRLLGIGAAAAVVLVALLVFAPGRPRQSATSGAGPPVLSTAAGPVALQAPVASAPVALPHELPATVTVTIESNPSGAKVMRGTEALGTTPAKVVLPRGGERQALTLQLDGFESARVEVEPRADHTAIFPLQPLRAAAKASPPRARAPASEIKARPAPSGGIRNEIEANPFP